MPSLEWFDRLCGDLQGDDHEEYPLSSRYQLRGELGRGSLAVVYRAWDRRLNRDVAVKMIRDDVEITSNDLARFSREAVVLTRLSHPNIMSVLNAGREGTQMFLVTELVDGEPLSLILEKRRQGLQDLLVILEKVARGVHHAHENGIIHRDLKPSNIMISPAKEPKVGDFSVAHLMEISTVLTQKGVRIGTVAYMAPEQVDGREDGIDARTDVYALGVILYQIVTGTLPFYGKTPLEIFEKILHENPIPPRKVNSSIDPDIEEICLKAMERDRGRRYGSALELAEDLKRIRVGEISPTKPRHLSRPRISRLAQRRALVLKIKGSGNGLARRRPHP